jgi:hypothetical protein
MKHTVHITNDYVTFANGESYLITDILQARTCVCVADSRSDAHRMLMALLTVAPDRREHYADQLLTAVEHYNRVMAIVSSESDG